MNNIDLLLIKLAKEKAKDDNITTLIQNYKMLFGPLISSEAWQQVNEILKNAKG